METNSPESGKTKGKAFVEYVINRLSSDNAFGARLRRADNRATEYQSWEYLVKWCDIEKPWERLPFALVAAALAKAKPKANGYLGIGKGISHCYDDKQNSDAAKAKLRRLLACNSIEDAVHVLRPLLSLVQSKGVPLDYGKLLDELQWFGTYGEKQKLRWANEFFERRDEYDSNNVQS
ncbi:MAG: type I-E CRISPR-associated protein Cse2/CasB [Clostridiaceae bacterium]|nr:type I-E CRISPR-associated protein Cse2/CasB [Clostridiaceae bacterium]